MNAFVTTIDVSVEVFSFRFFGIKKYNKNLNFFTIQINYTHNVY